MNKPKVLIVDDEPVICQLLERSLKDSGYEVSTQGDSQKALESINNEPFNILITDLKMPQQTGMQLLESVKRVNPHAEVIVITGYPSIESAVEAVKIGAYDFVTKPFDMPRMHETIIKCLEKQKRATDFFDCSELMELFEITNTLNAGTTLDMLLRQIMDTALKITKSTKGWIFIKDNNTRKLNIQVIRELQTTSATQEYVDTLNGNAVAATGTDATYGSLACIPFYAEGNTLGGMHISGRFTQESYSERERILLSILAGQAARAIECLSLRQQIADSELN